MVHWPYGHARPELLRHYDIEMIDGTVKSVDAEGCWPSHTVLEWRTTVMVGHDPRDVVVQRCAMREVVRAVRDDGKVWDGGYLFSGCQTVRR